MRVSPKSRSTKPRNCVWPSPKRSNWLELMQALAPGLQSETGEGSASGAGGAGEGGGGEGGTFWMGAGAAGATGEGLGAGPGACAATLAAAARTPARPSAAARLDHIRRHAHDVEPAVDVEDLARDPAREARDEEQGGVAHLLLLRVLAQGRVRAMVFEHLRDAVHAGSGDGLDGAGGDGVDADAPGAEVRGQV